MGKKARGFEFLLKYGTAGTTAPTAITNATDTDYNVEPERGETTVRGAGVNPPVVTSRVTALKPTVTFKMLSDDADTTFVALMAAEMTGVPVAIRCIEKSTGKGFDGDMNLSAKIGATLKGVEEIEFTAEATDEIRTPSLWI